MVGKVPRMMFASEPTKEPIHVELAIAIEVGRISLPAVVWLNWSFLLHACSLKKRINNGPTEQTIEKRGFTYREKVSWRHMG